jgi:hypothetical protein
MQQYKNIQGTQANIPLIEINTDTVYIRSNVKDIHTEDIPTLWQYDETQMTYDEYYNLVGSHDADIDAVKVVKLDLLNGKCSGAIYQGLDIGAYHYNFTPTSQTNLETIARLIQSGQTKFLYRADNETAQREYSDTEMNVIIRAKDEWITINTNYYELLKTWINRENEISTIESIDYGNQLPADLMQELATRCNVVGIDITKYANLFN